ncbi:MAG: NADH-quinone oxidoreductase subunit K [Hyphomicrobiales bacterium]
MTAAIFGICAALLVGIGAFGLISRTHLLRRIIAFNVIGSGVFLTFGALGSRHPDVSDPVPQAFVITGIVVALAATALAVTLIIRLFEETGRAGLPGEDEADDPGSD